MIDGVLAERGSSDVPQYVQRVCRLWRLAMAHNPMGLYYGFPFAFHAGLICMWQVSPISSRLEASIGGSKDWLLMCRVSRISLSVDDAELTCLDSFCSFSLQF